LHDAAVLVGLQSPTRIPTLRVWATPTANGAHVVKASIFSFSVVFGCHNRAYKGIFLDMNNLLSLPFR